MKQTTTPRFSIFFDKSGTRTMPMCMQADFSTARQWQAGTWYESRDAFPVGTCGYMAPEIVLEEGYDHTADWFSLGVVLLEAALGRWWSLQNNQNDLDLFLRLWYTYAAVFRLPWSKDDLSMLNRLAEGQLPLQGLHNHLQHLLSGLLRFLTLSAAACRPTPPAIWSEWWSIVPFLFRLKYRTRLGSRGIKEIKAMKYFSESSNNGNNIGLQVAYNVLEVCNEFWS